MITRFFHGMRFFGRGWGVAFGRRELVPFVLAPAILAVVITLSGTLWVHHAASLYIAEKSAGHGAFVGALIWLGVMLLVLAAAYLIYNVSCLVATAPFGGVLSERTQAIATGEKIAPQKFMRAVADSWRGAGHALLGALIYFTLAAPIFAMQYLMIPLAPLFWFFSIVQAALFFAFDGFNEPLHRTGAGFGDKWRFVFAHGAESLGFGTAVALMMMIPFVSLIVTPVSVVGGTLLYLELRQKPPTAPV